jgi:radical SAM protein with 4Fe4S-binding SPASM domain
MISLSRLACDHGEEGDRVRYASRTAQSGLCRVVVWNTTRRCDLRCRHCYASCDGRSDDELSFTEGRELLSDLSGCGVQVVLLSGGEPLLRERILDLVDHAAAVGLRPVLSTNGQAMTPAIAHRLTAAGLGYVGISLDGSREVHNEFRRSASAYDGVLRAIRTCQDAGLKVGLRFTVTRANQQELPAVFDLLEAERIPRICVYHLAYAGRGKGLSDQDQSHHEMRSTLSWLLTRTRALHHAGNPVEVLTVDNHADGPWLLLRLAQEGDLAGVQRVAGLLARGGGNSTGERIGCVSWDGAVHPDQFWRSAVVGNVRQRPFSAIWSDPQVALLAQLRQRRSHLRCRCTHCRFFDLCRGNLRARAEAATGDAWAEDPACHLSDAEIAGAFP